MSNNHFTSDIAMFNNELYVCGNFYSFTEDIYRLAKWNGSDWIDVGGGLNGGIVDPRVMTVFDTLLVIGGDFDMSVTGGNNVMGWNGSAWNSFRGWY